MAISHLRHTWWTKNIKDITNNFWPWCFFLQMLISILAICWTIFFELFSSGYYAAITNERSEEDVWRWLFSLFVLQRKRIWNNHQYNLETNKKKLRKRTELSFEKTTALSKLSWKYLSDTATKTIKIMKENKKEVITLFLIRITIFCTKDVLFETHIFNSLRNFGRKEIKSYSYKISFLKLYLVLSLFVRINLFMNI